MTSKDGKVFCAESEQLLKTWVAGIRLAKVSVYVYSRQYVMLSPYSMDCN